MTKSHLVFLLFTCATWGCGEMMHETVRVEDSTPLNPGTIGAPIWTDSSIALTVRTHTYFDTWGGGGAGPLSITSCRTASREELTESQLEHLKGIELIALQDQCTADGFSYVEIEVQGDDGTVSTFRDTGCDYLKVAGANAELPLNVLPPDFQLNELTEC